MMGSIELLKGRLDRLHEVMAARVDHGKLPGLVTVVADRGAVRLANEDRTSMRFTTPAH